MKAGGGTRQRLQWVVEFLMAESEGKGLVRGRELDDGGEEQSRLYRSGGFRMVAKMVGVMTGATLVSQASSYEEV